LDDVYRDCLKQPHALQQAVDSYHFGDLTGRAALAADIRREVGLILNALASEHPAGNVSAVPNGGGLIWRLAMLRAYENLTAAREG